MKKNREGGTPVTIRRWKRKIVVGRGGKTRLSGRVRKKLCKK